MANSTASACSYTDSRKPGPSSRCTAMAAAMIDSVICESLNAFPAFLLSSDISNGSFRAGFFPAGVVGHGDGRNRFFLDQFFGCVLRREGWGNGFLGTRREFLREFFDKTLRWPRAGFAKCTDGAPRDVIADGFQCFRIFHHTAAAQHAIGDFLHPKGAFPAGCALAAALVRVKLIDVVQRPNHVA